MTRYLARVVAALLYVICMGHEATAQQQYQATIPGTWALEPVWTSFDETSTQQELQDALGDYLDSVNGSISNAPEYLTLERALDLTIKFVFETGVSPNCATVIGAWLDAGLTTNDFSSILDQLPSLTDCNQTGYIDADDQSEKPNKSPYDGQGLICISENINLTDNCTWYFFGDEPPQPVEGTCWFPAVINPITSEVIAWKLVICEGAGCSPCQDGDPAPDRPLVSDPPPSSPSDDRPGNGGGGAGGGSNGDDQGGGDGGGPGGGGGSGSTDASLAKGSSGESSGDADLELNGEGAKTCNPTLVADGFKVEDDSDLVVSLPGRDFVLHRSYYGGTIMRDAEFPWAIGPGWGTSADGWINYKYRGVASAHSPVGQMIDVTAFPMEFSAQYIDEDTSDDVDEDGFLVVSPPPANFVPIGPNNSRIRPSTRTIAGSTVNVLILEAPGRGQTVYVNDASHVLHTRIIEQRDEYDNVWKYEYIQFNLSTAGMSKPRLNRILLGAESGQAAKAIVRFYWNVGEDSQNAKNGRVARIEVARNFTDGLGRDKRIITQIVEYWYGSDLDDWDTSNNTSLYDHYETSGLLNNLMLVRTRTLLNAPALTESNRPESLPLPQYFDRYWHYRYADYDPTTKMAPLSHVFEPVMIDRLAEDLEESDRWEAVLALIAADTDEQIGATGKTPAQYATKLIDYHGGENAGKVKRQVIRAGCGCGGDGGMTFSQSFEYAERPITMAAVEISNTNTFYPRRMSQVTTRTDEIWIGSTSPEEWDDWFDPGPEDWSVLKTARSWSETLPVIDGITRVGSPQGAWASKYMVILSPFVIADEVQGGDTVGRSYHHFDSDQELNGRLQRLVRFHTDAIAGFNTDEEGLLDFDYTDEESYWDAVEWNATNNGLVEWWLYNEWDSITHYGIRRGWTRDENNKPIRPTYESSEFTPAGVILLKKFDYWDLQPAQTRNDLLKSTTEYPTPSTPVTKNFDYEFYGNPVTPYARVRVQKTTLDREAPEENGPGGDVHSWRGFYENGAIAWDVTAAGENGDSHVATTYQYEQTTGQLMKEIFDQTASAVNQLAGGVSGPTLPTSTEEAEARTTEIVVDALGRTRFTTDPSGVEREFEYLLGRLPSSTVSDPSNFGSTEIHQTLDYLTVIEYPHDLGGTSGFDGPIVIQWADADLNLIRRSTYEAGTTFETNFTHLVLTDLGESVERSRTVHVYDSGGNLARSIVYPVLRSSLLNGSTDHSHALVTNYAYDGAGRLIRETAPDGHITEIDYDGRNRPVEKRYGRVAGPDGIPAAVDPRAYQWLYYDHVDSEPGNEAASGDGESEPSLVVSLVDVDGTNEKYRSVRTIFDWRGRPRLTFTLSSDTKPTGDETDAADGTYAVSVLDNLSRPTETFIISGGDMDELIEKLKLDEFYVNWAATDPFPARISSYVRTSYSARGLVWRSETAINPRDPEDDGEAGFLRTDTWYDDAGRVLVSRGPTGPVTRSFFDRLGRVTTTEVRDGGSARVTSPNFANVLSGSGEIIFEKSVSHFDSITAMPWLVTHSRRRHDATGYGLGDDPVVTYVGTSYDDAGRPMGVVDFGVGTDAGHVIFTTGGDAPIQSEVIEAINDVLADPTDEDWSGIARVTGSLYNEIGQLDRVVDPEGRVTMTLFDDMGRTIGVVDNAEGFAGGTRTLEWQADLNIGGMGGYWMASDSPEDVDQDRLTTMVYDRGGREHLRVAHVAQPGSTISVDLQFTEFVRDPARRTETDLDTSFENRAELPGPLFEIRYPDRGEGEPGTSAQTGTIARSDLVRHGYNLAGEQIALQDQNGTVRTFTRDVAGRPLTDTVVEFGSMQRDGTHRDVDAWANTIATTYDSAGRTESIQTKNGASVLNEVKYTYDSRGRLVEVAQEADGAVSEPTSPVIELEYTTTPHNASSGPKNTDRLEALVYSDESRWVQDYGTGADDAISRVVGLRLDNDLLVEYTHLGLGTVAITDLVEAGVQSDRTADIDGSRRFGTLTTTDAGVYPGWDRFGRLRLLSWVDVDLTTGAGDLPSIPPIFQHRYERDRVGNVLRQTDARPGASWTTRDRKNVYDELHRLIETSAADDLDAQAPAAPAFAPQETREWTLDAVGNWVEHAVDLNNDGDATDHGETQEREHNLANEVEELTSGLQTHYYDDAGNLGKVTSGDEYELVYDAWGRLVEVRDGSTIIARYRYNGLHWRTMAEQYTTGSPSSRERFIYSPDWQLLEQHTHDANDGLVMSAQQFWGKRAADDAVMRRIDRDPGEDDGFEDTYYYITDHLRSVIAVVDHAGSLVERVTYGPYGEPKHHRPGDMNGDGAIDNYDLLVITPLFGSSVEIDDEDYEADADINRDGDIDYYDILLVLADLEKDPVTFGISDAETVANPIGYAGYVYLPDFGTLGHWLARHRIFDPVMGRWITRDPAGYVDGMSLYLYARGNPWMFVDPLGLASCPEDRDFREFNEREQGILLNNRTNEHLVRAYTERERLKRVLATNKNLPAEQRAELEAELRYLETVTATINKVGGPLGKEDTEAVQSLVAAYSQFLDTAGKEIGAATDAAYGSGLLFGMMAGAGGKAVLGKALGGMGGPATSAKAKTTAEMGEDLANQIGRNRVSARTAGGSQIDIDLRGKKHFDKSTGKYIDTPHVHEAPLHMGPTGQLNKGPGTVRPATKQDIRTAKKLAED